MGLHNKTYASRRLGIIIIAALLVAAGTVVSLPQASNAALVNAATPSQQSIEPMQTGTCPTAWEWHYWHHVDHSQMNGSTPDGGSVSWPLEGYFDKNDVLFDNLRSDSIKRITSSDDRVLVGLGGQVAYAYLDSSGSATLTVEFKDPGCKAITLHVTVEVTKAPTVSDTSTNVQTGSTSNRVNLRTEGYEISSVAIATVAKHGLVNASGTQIFYTPLPGFSGTDSFTYEATNVAGTSAPATATIVVEPIVHTVSWASSGPGNIGAVSRVATPEVFLSSPSLVEDGQEVAFWRPEPELGASYSKPSGCRVHPVGPAWYTDPITADCEVAFDFEEITFTPDVLPHPTAGSPYESVINASGGAWDFSYTLEAGALPDGLELTGDGTLAGTAMQTGHFAFTVRAENERGHSAVQSYRFAVAPEPEDPSVTSGPLPDGVVGEEYAFQLTAAGDAPLTFSATGLPQGLTFHQESGWITGTPLLEGTFDVMVTVDNAAGSTTEMHIMAIATVEKPIESVQDSQEDAEELGHQQGPETPVLATTGADGPLTVGTALFFVSLGVFGLVLRRRV